MRILPEEVFLEYEDPLWGETSEALEDLARLMGGHDALKSDEKDTIQDAMKVQSSLRVNGATISNGLRYLKRESFLIANKKQYRKVIDCLSRLVPNVRTWEGRGWTQHELVEKGLLPRLAAEQLLTFEEYQDSAEMCDDEGDRDWEPDAWDTGVLSPAEAFQMMKLPPASYPSGPVDFSFVKDRERREKVLREYEDLRDLTRDFVREYVIRELKSSERQAAKRRLGFTDEDLGGIPSELPIRLSFADQARFAEETIKRLHALGKFATIYHGME